MAQAARVVWRDLWHRFPAPGLGGGRRAKVRLPPDPDDTPVEAFFVSTIVVGVAEIGDKTQILSMMLAARFLRPVPIIFGILFATIANHAAAGLAGTFFGGLLSGPWMRSSARLSARRAVRICSSASARRAARSTG